MKMRKFAFMFLMLITLCFGTTSYCQDLDSINQNQQTGDGSPSSTDESYNNVGDMLRGYNALDDESMAKASKLANPVTSIIGVITGWVLMVTSAGVFLVTALDLAYIAIPFTRDWLNPAGGMQGGMQGGMPGGMNAMGGMQGGQQQPTSGRKFVSDEAIQAIAMAGGQAQQGSPMGGGMMGGGMMGGGMMGGGMMGGGMAQSQQPAGGKSVIMTYFKKRVFFMILFAISTTILMSSLLFDCGLNIGELLYKIISLFSDGISNVQM